MSKETNFLNSFLEQTALNLFPPALLLAPAVKAVGASLKKDESEYGLPVSMPDGDIKYTLKGYGPQSGETYKKMTGEYPAGYKPTPRRTAAAAPSPTPDPSPSSTAAFPPIPALPGSSTPEGEIPQTTDKMPGEILDELRKVLDPERLQQILDIQNQAAIERSIVTSALAREQTKELTARKIEEENIKAWRDARVAQINANATQAAALAATIWGSFQMNPNIMSEAFKAALQPITLTRRT